ncbi:hypothetical protein EJB05_01407, partial [Eragrostis curvula]
MRRQQEKEKMDLVQLVMGNKGEDLSVIAVCGASVLLGETSVVKRAYNDLKGNKDRFKCYAWVRITHPFSPGEFLRDVIRQFYVGFLEQGAKAQNESGPTQDLMMMARMKGDALVDGFVNYLHGQSYLVVLADLSTIEEWDQINAFFPNNKKGSRLVVCTEHVEVASLCIGPETVLPNHKQLSTDQTLHIFYQKGLQVGTGVMEPGSTIGTSEFNISVDKQRHSQMDVLVAAFQESQLIGRENEKSEIIKMVSKESEEFEVISIYGMGGQGKTTLVKHIYQSQGLIATFDKRACVTIKRPFNSEELIKTLRTQLIDKNIPADDRIKKQEKQQEDKIAPVYSLLEGKKFLIVLDDLSSTTEWDALIHNFPKVVTASRIIVTTREKSIAKHCSKKEGTIYKLKTMEENDARNLFSEKSAVDLSRIRSLTVFAKWRPFFISHKMRMLRVLDLEGTDGLVNHHLEHIGKLLHLKYLSLRGCGGIFHLPDSMGNLKQLQTLDVSDTRIIKLPKTIVKLRNLQFLRGGNSDGNFYEPWEVLKEVVPTLCVGCLNPKVMGDKMEIAGDTSRSDVCTAWCCVMFPFLGKEVDSSGILLPRGVRKLKSLHTVGTMNIAPGKASILKDIRQLSQLRKLEVTGIDEKNCQQLCSVLVHLSRLESLSLQSSMVDTELRGLDEMCSPPKRLESLKLAGRLEELPQWIGDLHSLVKLKLERTYLVRPGATIRVLGKLPKLSILCLSWGTFQYGEDLRLNFNRVSLPSLMVLQLLWVDHAVRSMEFGGAMPKLELMRFCGSREEISAGFISGLASLPRLRAFELHNRTYEEEFVEDIKIQLHNNTNRPVFKWCNIFEA